jgi:hypothetical protein
MIGDLLFAAIKAALTVGFWILSCALNSTYYLYSKLHQLRKVNLDSHSDGVTMEGNVSISQWKPFNVITLGHIRSNNNNRIY